MTAVSAPSSTVPDRFQLPEGVCSLADHEKHAQGLMDAATWAYFNGGAADEITLRANVAAWQQIPLYPRVLRPMHEAHTRVTLLGRTWSHPVLVAPMAYQCLAHPHGEQATALAAAAMGAGMVLSTQSSTSMEDVARLTLADNGRGPLWFQLYLQGDRALTCELVRRAEDAGYEALVVTVDAPVQGARNRERRAGFQLPSHVRAVHLDGHEPPSPAALLPGQSALFDAHLKHTPTWNDIEWLRCVTRLPIVLKGIGHPDDALQAHRSGAAGVIVSNHGGRVLDTTPPSAALLPAVAQALQGDLPVLVDGGIRRGTDILKALGLGACAVMVGRPVLHGLANAGAVGVAHVLRLLRDELEMTMALTGCTSLSSAHESLVVPSVHIGQT
ncbi:alpha-hydroxy acid oxidase [Hydrogenophaga sp.]|uniref:alpha-hydroxy acid oxidase n=1 Tax=Hydrogenophaga sp. TaxID=1904254 RepID=UPI00272841C0|nr:alpha-hydroxy acid oxidase [Hydrogenophaga sp.]MDO8904708.1 alpha-hydroxy acid oxidase [Hydrogenophaga sp.]